MRATPAQQMALPFDGAWCAPPAPLPAQQQRADENLHHLCQRWVAWQRTRRFYAPAPPVGTLCRIAAGEGGYKQLRAIKGAGGPDALLDARLAAFHLAWLAQSDERLDKAVFNAWYLHRSAKGRPLPVKTLASGMGISRQQFHRLLAQFRSKTWRAAQAILAAEFGRRPCP